MKLDITQIVEDMQKEEVARFEKNANIIVNDKTYKITLSVFEKIK